MSRAEMFAFATVFLSACQASAVPPGVVAPADAEVVRVSDVGTVIAEDVTTIAADESDTPLADASVPPCDGALADAGLRRRSRRSARPRFPSPSVQPCYGLPFGD